jgi:TRAP-type uncharacterized transport system fused permease subunit
MFCLLYGLFFSILVGVFASKLFVPFLQIGSTSQANYPPFQIEIAWLSIFQIYGLFIILFIVMGSFLQESGAGQFFFDFAHSVLVG